MEHPDLTVSNPNSPRVDRSAFSVVFLEDKDRADKEYWMSKTPGERLEAIEAIRQVLYGYDPTAARLQRVLEIVRRT